MGFCPSCGNPTKAGDRGYAPSGGARADIQDAQDNKLMAILAYIGVLVLVPLLTGAHKTSPFAKYHTNQGVVLFIVEAAYGIVCGTLSAIFSWIPFFGWVVTSALGLPSLVLLGFCIFGIFNAVNGKTRPLPVIGGVTLIK
jgi:uncharacterized membrane protein